MTSPPGFDAVVLAGGSGRRLGGVDKGSLMVGGRTLLDRVLLACRAATSTVVVGDARPVALPVRWVREQPAGGGPLAAIAAGCGALPAAEVVAVLATDLPRLTGRDVERLLAALAAAPEDDGAVFTDDGGRMQLLAGAYRGPALRDALHGVGPAAGVPVSVLLRRLRLVSVPDGGAAADCDTPDDLSAARADLDRQE